MTELLKTRPDAQVRKKRLLIMVDNDAQHLYYTGIMLQRLDYTIYTTKTAEEALEIIHITVPSVVVTEAVLQKMSGVELLRRIRQNAKTASVPVIILTSSPDPAVKQDCLREGCTSYMRKPADPDALYAAIQQATEPTPRSYIRLKTCLDVIVGDGAGAEGARSGECITAVSENGLYVSTPAPKPVGSRLHFTVFLENKPVKIEGEVMYSFTRGQGPLHSSGMGIKFTRIAAEDRGLIRAFIKKVLTQDLHGHASGT